MASKSWLLWPWSICVLRQTIYPTPTCVPGAPLLCGGTAIKEGSGSLRELGGCHWAPCGSCCVAIACSAPLSSAGNQGFDWQWYRRKKGDIRSGCFWELGVRVLSKNCNFGAHFSQLKAIKSSVFVGERLQACWAYLWTYFAGFCSERSPDFDKCIYHHK